MSKSSFAERNKAVKDAWNKERELVQEGKGTREWTPEQQKDILEKGRAYDDNGKAFEGQHMKSAERYPESQRDPGNIQFLTRDEHLDAHDGNWQNPTNWYYDPATKEKISFGNGPFIPCEIIQLSEPVACIAERNTTCQEQDTEKVQQDKQKEISNLDSTDDNETYRKPEAPIPPKTQMPKKTNKFVSGLKSVGRFIMENPQIVFACAAFGATVVVSAKKGNNSGGTQKTSIATDSSSTNVPSIREEVAGQKVSRAGGPVSGHKRRCHTKNGDELKYIHSYHRRGNRN